MQRRPRLAHRLVPAQQRSGDLSPLAGERARLKEGRQSSPVRSSLGKAVKVAQSAKAAHEARAATPSSDGRVTPTLRLHR